MAPRPRIQRISVRREDPDNVAAGEIAVEIEAALDSDFDEPTYLRAFPDIADAVRRGVLASGLVHFREVGRAEARLEKAEYRALLAARPAPPQVVVDTLTISPAGSTLITGWTDDRSDELVEVNLELPADTRHHWAAIPRLARSDVERTPDAGSEHRFGFLLVAAPIDRATRIDARLVTVPRFRFASGIESQPKRREPVVASDADLRDLALAALQTAAGGDADTTAIYHVLDQHLGAQIAAINRLIIDQARPNRLIEHFGATRDRYRGSIITTLRGPAEQIVPRLTLMGAGRGAHEYEFIVIIPHVEQFEPALRAARVAEATLDLSLSLVLQHGADSAGPGADAAQDIARSNRLIFMDQAVFPRDRDWIFHHSALLDDAPPEQTRLMGGMLYRPDGSLSNGGYYFEQETSVLPKSMDPPRRISAVKLKTITHPAPSVARCLPAARPVVGVPAAFMSVDRSWFETLGGFTGHYSRAVHEDIDLCLRSLKRNVPAWIHHLPMWHFDRRPPLRPEPAKGGAILNGWLLHRQWDAMIVPDLLGPTPTLTGLKMPDAGS